MRPLILTLALLATTLLQAQEEIAIWPGLAPGTENRKNEEFIANERFKNIYQPSLTVHLPPRELANGTAALLIPGGGYGHIAIYKEGHHVASWLNRHGVAAFVLKYRLDRDEALADATQAIRVIRREAETYQLDPQKLGIFGFSAGGHLLLNTVAHATPETKPNFLVIMYPALYGLDPADAFAANAAPSFLVGTSDDTTTPPANLLTVYQSIIAAGQSAELHLYPTGGHGFGLGLYRGPVKDWPDRCADWLQSQNLINP